MSRRHLAVTVTAVGLLCSSAVAAAHADSPALGRLSGTFDVTGKVTQSTNGEPVGTTWCARSSLCHRARAGARPTMSIRTRGDGVVVKNLLSPTLNSYKGDQDLSRRLFPPQWHSGCQCLHLHRDHDDHAHQGRRQRHHLYRVAQVRREAHRHRRSQELPGIARRLLRLTTSEQPASRHRGTPRVPDGHGISGDRQAAGARPRRRRRDWYPDRVTDQTWPQIPGFGHHGGSAAGRAAIAAVQGLEHRLAARQLRQARPAITPVFGEQFQAKVSPIRPRERSTIR